MISAAFAERLEVGIDRDFLASQLARVRGLAARPWRVLLLASATMKYQLNVVVWFFEHLSVAACDCVVVHSADRCLLSQPRKVRMLRTIPGLGEHYDVVVGFDTMRGVLEQCATRGVPGLFIGKPSHLASDPTPDVNLRRPILVFSTQVSCAAWSSFEACFGGRNCEQRAGIDFPPNIPCHLAPVTRPRINVLLPGGGDRDYASAVQLCDRFHCGILVSNADDSLHDLDPRDRIALLQGHPHFRLLPWVRGDLYARLIAHSRIVWLPVLGNAEGDYTSAADAIWYGKPVLTNPVKAQTHMADRLLLYRSPQELARHLEVLSDPISYAQVCARVRCLARDKNNLFSLLVRAWAEMLEG